MTTVVLTSGILWQPPPSCPAGTVVGVSAVGGGSGATTATSSYVITPHDFASGVPYVLGSGPSGTNTSWSTNNLNTIQVSNNLGAAVGNPGTLPINSAGSGLPGWYTLNASGLTSVAAFGLLPGGLPYTDIGMSGICTIGSFLLIFGDSLATGSLPWTVSAQLQIIAGSLANVNYIYMGYDTYSGPLTAPTVITYGKAQVMIAPTGTLAPYSATATTDAGTTVIFSSINFGTSTTLPINFTLRIVGVQLEQATSPTFFKSTPGYVSAAGSGVAGTAGTITLTYTPSIVAATTQNEASGLHRVFGRGVGAVSGEVVALAEVSAHRHSDAVSASSAQALSGSRQTFRGSPTMGTVAVEMAAVVFGRFRGGVVATAQPSITAVCKSVGRTLRVISSTFNPFSPSLSTYIAAGAASGLVIPSQPQVTNLAVIKASGHTMMPPLTSAQSASLARGSLLLRNTASSSVAALVHQPGRVLGAASPQAFAFIKVAGRVLSATSASVVAITRSTSKHLGATLAQVVHLPPGGSVFARVFGAVSSQSASVGRGLSASRGAVSSSVAGLARAPSKIVGAANASVASMVKAPGKVLRAATASVVALVSPGLHFLIRSVSTASSVALQPSVNRLAAVMHAIQAQVVALFTTHVRPQASSTTSANVAAAATQRTRTVQQAMATVQAQAAALTRGSAKVLFAAAVSAQALFRSIGKVGPVAAGSVVSLITTRFAPRSFSTAAASVANLIRGLSVARGVTSAESVTASRQRGRGVGVASGSAVGLRRLTNKILAVAQQQATAGGRGTSKSVSTTSPEAGHLFTPRSVVLRAVQSSVAGLVSWYYLFIADWAYQQTILYPPPGGPPEPPAFGPLDPADESVLGFDWSKRANTGDAIVSATILSVPPGVVFGPAPAFISGNIVRVTVMPFNPASPFTDEFTIEVGDGATPPFQLPTTFALRCSATFASGRVSSMTVPVIVRTL